MSMMIEGGFCFRVQFQSVGTGPSGPFIIVQLRLLLFYHRKWDELDSM